MDINWGLVSVIKPLFPDKSRNEAKFTGPHKISALWSSRNSGSSTLLMPSVILPLDLSVQLALAVSSSSCGGLSPLMLKSMDLSTSTVCEVFDWRPRVVAFCFSSVIWTSGGEVHIGCRVNLMSTWPTQQGRGRTISNRCSSQVELERTCKSFFFKKIYYMYLMHYIQTFRC